MNGSFYTAAVGAAQQLQHLNVQSNNIANVNTYGYKAQRGVFSSLMYENVINTESGYERSGLGAAMARTVTNFTQGGAVETGWYQDYLINGDGFFALADLDTGEITFTRNGAFILAGLQQETGGLDEDGQPIMETRYYLSDGNGRFVLSEYGTIIEVTDPTEAQPVGVFDYRNYDGITRLTDGRFLPVDKNGNVMRGSGEVIQGMLELSNADLAEELTKVIEAQRAYSMALRMVMTSDEIETTINNLRR